MGGARADAKEKTHQKHQTKRRTVTKCASEKAKNCKKNKWKEMDCLLQY